MRSFSQIPVRIKYFIAISDYEGGRGVVPISDFDPTIRLYSPAYPGPILTQAEYDATYTDPSGYEYPPLSAGELLKDLGQQFVVTDSDYNHRVIYRRVQRVKGINSEGVSGDPSNGWDTFYVKVWDSEGAPTGSIYVARTG